MPTPKVDTAFKETAPKEVSVFVGLESDEVTVKTPEAAPAPKI